jgi:2-oxoglutarate ferredoxin oxidoreductase subunit beta
MANYSFLKTTLKSAWCAGCGLHTINKAISDVMSEIGWTDKNTVVVSGIGCSGLASQYYEADSVESDHGRAIPLAEGIKVARPDLNVIVISGDGDLLGIGGDHLLHTARRNTNIKVICNQNDVYAMTGGQLSPTTPLNDPTKTSVKGSHVPPINVQSIITGNDKHFFARTTITDLNHMKDSIRAALSWDGFAFVDILSMCPTNHGRIMGFNTPVEMLMSLKNRVTNPQLESDKLVIDYK